MKRCAACGQDNDDWRPFCTRCGASYTGPAAEPRITPPPPGAPPPPVPPGASGSPAAPSTGRRRPSNRVVAVAAAMAVVVAVGAFVGLTAVSSGGHKQGVTTTTTTFPATWDPSVITLVQFDSKARKLDYRHPVKVVFLSKAEFKKRVTVDASKVTAKQRRELDQSLESMRAMGMVNGNPDLLAKENQLAGATTLAYYDFTKKEIVIPTQTLDVEERVTLAHELTHTLDDESFDLTRVEKIGDRHDTDATTALIEGDAVWVQDQYEAGLKLADRRAYVRSQETAVAPGDLKGVPKIFGLLGEWPYEFGPLFISILHKEGGQSRVNKAFGTPPIDEEQVIDPITYLDADGPGPIAAPTLPAGAKKLDGGKEFGLLAWYLVLAERIDPHEAMHAALGWGADAYTIDQEGSRTCMDIRYRGETLHDNSEMLTALHHWIAALPAGMATVKANADHTLTLHSCDPGTTAKVVTNRSTGAYALLLFRDQVLTEFVKDGSTPELATCVADGITDQTSVADVLAGRTPAIATNPAAIAQIGATCRATVGTVVGRGEIDQ